MRKKMRIAVLAALALSLFATRPEVPLLLAQQTGERDTLLTDYKRDLVITGNAVMADGSLPPQPVAIQLVCASNAQRVAQTDAKGFFNFQLAQQLPSIQDAVGSNRNVYPARPETSPDTGGLGIQPASSGNIQSTPLDCEFRALLTGFRSTSVKSTTMQRQNTVVNIGTIVLLRAENQGATISSTSMSAPPRARKAYEKAYANLRKRDFSAAQRELEQAVKQYPQYAAAWSDLGRLHAQQNRLDQARQAFMQAKQADERFVPAYIGLASIALRQSQWTEAQELSSRATQLGGAESPLGFYYNAVANFQLGKWDDAEKSARAAARFDTRLSPQVKLLLGSIAGAKGDYAAAAEEFKSYLKLLPTAATFLTPRGGFPVPLRGRAWAAADNYHVERMEADVAKPIDEIALRKDYIIIDYRPVEFPKRHVELWLPETVDLYLDLLGQRSHRQHSFSSFELFWVETAEKTKEPEVR